MLIVLLLVLWGSLNWAGSVIGSALGGSDGAIVARAPAKSTGSSDSDDGGPSEPDEPLEGEEVVRLQTALNRFGYEAGPVDGLLGNLTRSAANAAKADLGLSAASDHRLLDTLTAALEALESTPREQGQEQGQGHDRPVPAGGGAPESTPRGQG